MTGEAPLGGGCLCGAVRYEIDTVLHSDHCHCLMCRKASGAAMVSWMTVAATAFRWTKGRPVMFHSSPVGERSVCGVCGTKMTFRHAELPDELDVTVGSLDDPDRIAPKEHLHGESWVPWVDIDPQIPWRDGHAPTPSATPAAMPEGRHEGGCLCGAVRYAVTGAPTKSGICHCGMCRKQTGGVLMAWGVWPRDRFADLSGDTTRIQTSPAAARRFCPTCGSTVFFEFESTGASGPVEIMLAGLDRMEAISPTFHQFTDDAPSWLQFSDSRPLFPGRSA